MANLIFLAVLATVLINLLGWGFKYLPGERWQMLAVVPVRKKGESGWHGANLTYYGFFIATSQLISLVLLFILLGAMGVSLFGVASAVLLVLFFSLPAARLVAMVVEQKRHTFTVGGASFVGIVAAPWCIIAVNRFLSGVEEPLPIIPVLAAMSIGYTLGEGLGRLGCISYGCCYGKPVKACPRWMQIIFKRTGLIFHGQLKKVAYEGQLAGERLVPIQAITCLLYTGGAIIGTALFLRGYYTAALLFTIILTQLWRVLSEIFRADFRGFGKITVYQKMGVLSVLYVFVMTKFLHAGPYVTPAIIDGLHLVWQPSVILGLQLLWMIFFIYFGRSTVTSSSISFELLRERI